MKHIYNANGNKVGSVTSDGTRHDFYDNLGNYKGSFDSNTGYTSDSLGNRSSWYDSNTGYSYSSNTGDRTSWWDSNTNSLFNNTGDKVGNVSDY